MFDRNTRSHMPETVKEAAERILSDLLTQHLQALSEMTEHDFDQLCDQVAPYVLDEFRIWQGNDPLLDACFSHPGDDPEPARVILNQVKQMLQDFHGFLVIT